MTFPNAGGVQFVVKVRVNASLGVVIRSRDSGRWLSLDSEFEARGTRIYVLHARTTAVNGRLRTWG